MKIRRRVDIEELCLQLTGELKIPGVVELWRSRVRALSRAITFVESDPLLAPLLLANEKFEGCFSQSRIVGITGLPGSGKSSLTNLIVAHLRQHDKTVAVLAVDPSSLNSGGAVLGDRVRMQEHFRDPGVFIRSMSNRGALGGVARSTRGAIRMAELLGFDFILVETVGIGQSESSIVELADTTVLVLMPNSGDEIQLMKAGIIQLADIYVVNKADLASPARMISEIHENTSPADATQWTPPVLSTSTVEKKGIPELVQGFYDHAAFELKNPNALGKKHFKIKKEVIHTMLAIVEPSLAKLVEQLCDQDLENIEAGKISAMALAHRLLVQNFSQLTEPGVIIFS